MNITKKLRHTGSVDGRVLSKQICDEIKEKVKNTNSDFILFLVAIDPPAQTRIYMNMKQRLAAKLGILVVQKVFTKKDSTDTIQKELKKDFDKYKNAFRSMVVQLPVPSRFFLEDIMAFVSGIGDPDFLLQKTRNNKLSSQVYPELFMPPVAAAVREVLVYVGLWKELSRKGYQVVVVGSGLLVGSAVSDLFSLCGVSHKVVDLKTPITQRLRLLRNADVVVSGAGDPWHITSGMVKKGVVIIDAGTMSVSGELRGDVHPSVYQKASVYTPVPGCIGPLSLACLMRNILLLLET